jgi:hypothetical protein
VKMYCKVYELIKLKKKKQQISLSLFRSYFISNDVDQWGTSKQYKNNQKWTKKHQLFIQPSYSSNTESNMKVVL